MDNKLTQQQKKTMENFAKKQEESKQFQTNLDNHKRQLVKEGNALYIQKKEMTTIEQEVVIQQMKIEELEKFRRI